MKLNRPWTGPWRIIKRLGEVAYRTKYEGSKSVGIKRRIVHHNQKEQFHEAPTLEMANANDDENEEGAAEIGDEAVVVVEVQKKEKYKKTTASSKLRATK